MTLAVIGAFDACMQKAMCVTRGRHVSWSKGIPQRRHSWTLSDKVFQGGHARGSLGANDEVWILQMQGLLVPPSRTETATGDRRQEDAHHIRDGRYSRVQSRTVPLDSGGTVDWQRLCHAIPRHAHDMT